MAVCILAACSMQTAEPVEPRSWADEAWRVEPLHPVVSDYDPDQVAQIPFIPLLTTDQPTEEHVIRVAEVFIEIFNYALATGDRARLDAHCHPQNAFCYRIVGRAERPESDVVRSEGGRVTVSDAHLIGHDATHDTWTVGMSFEQAPIHYELSDGTTTATDLDAGDIHVQITHWPSKGWLLREIVPMVDVED